MAIQRFIFILEFNGGTYLAQSEGMDIEHARTAWLDALDISNIDGMTDELYRQLKAELAEDKPVPVQGLTGVWCLYAAMDNNATALVHVVLQGAR